MQLRVIEQFNSAIDSRYFKETNDSKYANSEMGFQIIASKHLEIMQEFNHLTICKNSNC